VADVDVRKESTRSGSTSLRLLLRAQGGDNSALQQLFRRLLPSLQRWARGRLPGWARGSLDTSDLVQEAFVNAFRRLGHIEPRHRKALEVYLKEAIRNRIRDELRRVGRRGTAEELDESLFEAPGASPHDEAERTQIAERYRSALARMQVDDQQLLVARFDLGCSYEQIALATGRSSSDAARMALRRALLRLAAEIDAPG
jgi:RNA polymerase sigma-70 factor (ECF subfamily)